MVNFSINKIPDTQKFKPYSPFFEKWRRKIKNARRKKKSAINYYIKIYGRVRYFISVTEYYIRITTNAGSIKKKEKKHLAKSVL